MQAMRLESYGAINRLSGSKMRYEEVPGAHEGKIDEIFFDSIFSEHLALCILLVNSIYYMYNFFY